MCVRRARKNNSLLMRVKGYNTASTHNTVYLPIINNILYIIFYVHGVERGRFVWTIQLTVISFWEYYSTIIALSYFTLSCRAASFILRVAEMTHGSCWPFTFLRVVSVPWRCKLRTGSRFRYLIQWNCNWWSWRFHSMWVPATLDSVSGWGLHGPWVEYITNKRSVRDKVRAIITGYTFHCLKK